MKRFLIATAFIVSTTGLAVAQGNDQLRQIVEQDLATYKYDVDVSQLTDEQVTQLYFIATSTDSSSVRQDRYDRILRADSDATMTRSNNIRAFRPMAGDEDTEEVQTTMPRNQLRSLVQQMLETYEYDVDVMSLDDETLTGIFLVDTSTDDASEEKDRIEAILRSGGYLQ